MISPLDTAVIKDIADKAAFGRCKELALVLDEQRHPDHELLVKVCGSVNRANLMVDVAVDLLVKCGAVKDREGFVALCQAKADAIKEKANATNA